MDVQLAVGGLIQDAGVALHGPAVQVEGHLWEGVQVQPRLPQHQRQHLRTVQTSTRAHARRLPTVLPRDCKPRPMRHACADNSHQLRARRCTRATTQQA